MLAAVLLLCVTQTPAAPAAAAAPNAADLAAAARKAADAAKLAAEAAQQAAEALAAVAPAAGAAPPAAAPEAAQRWKGTAGLSLIALSGNASTLTTSGTLSLERRWTEWAMGVRASATYGQSRVATSVAGPEVTAMAAALELRGDRLVSQMVSAYVLAGVDADHVKSIEVRPAAEAGAGLVWIQTKVEDKERTFLRTDFALRYARESRFQYYPTATNIPDVDVLGPKVGLLFRHALGTTALITEELVIVPSVLGAARLQVNSQTKLSARLTQSLALALGLLVTHDSLPAAGKRPTDTTLTVGLEVAL